MLEKLERQPTQEKISEFEDLRGLDLSERNLKAVSSEILVTTDFDTKTIWPKQDKLPDGFNPEKVIEEAKNPGLGVRELHQEGIDGRGVRVAIIDQTLSSEQGEFMPHTEYASKIINYQEYGDAKDEKTSMHGPAVASLLVGETCGVAPGAELIYKATPSGRVFELRAKALMDIIESNRTAEPNKKVRIVSCSTGYMESNPEPGLDQWIGTIKKAEAEGIVIVDVGNRNGIDFLGGGTSGDKEDIDDYDKALFLADTEDQKMQKLISEKDVDGILIRLREIKKEEMSSFSDADLRKKIEESLAYKRQEIIIPSDYRTMASYAGTEEYMYNGKGGMSWSVPYLAGLFALALQVNPDLTKEEIANAINKTASVNKKGLQVVNPRGFIEEIKK